MLVHHDPRLRIGLDKPHLRLAATTQDCTTRIWRCAMEDTIPAFDKDPAVALRVWRGLYAHLEVKLSRPMFAGQGEDCWFICRANVVPSVPYKGYPYSKPPTMDQLTRCAPRHAIPCDDVVDGPAGRPFEIVEYQMPKSWLQQLIERLLP